eukprot:CAMPEP_0198250042 /NCGR_PEP_ID=MMETSP1447-20131203/1372_1 /TAXON_ID=420782 /ORGANISM="Chaetoceros dichaeta, Strain CCMP1751" /LENGTH=101 /DNA_ID=CAMNT_0043934807 /DNA_START=51 /DNA_END=356 /DNA_ORIENTATION=+
MNDDEDHYVKLVSADDKEFFLDRKVAIACSETMKAMLEGNFRESEDNIIRFPDIGGTILEKVVQYMYYKMRNQKATGPIPEFPIDPACALELLVASNYLNC